LKKIFVLAYVFACLFASNSIASEKEVGLRKGEELYVPVYSHLNIGVGYKIDLAATLSIRNTSHDKPIIIDKVEYYDNDGNLVRSEIKEPVEIKPMASTYYFVKVTDDFGGIGANYIVRWHSVEKTTPPVVETIMFGKMGQASLSFARSARVVKEVE